MVRKQAIGNLILNYLGYGLGSINYILLMPLFFSTTEIGLMRLLNTYAVVLGTLVTLGSSYTLVKFFSEYKTPDGKHNGFVSLLYIVLLVGYILLVLVFWIFEPQIMAIYAQKSPLFNEYYYHLVILILFSGLFLILESQAAVIYQTLLPVFLKEVLLRLLFTIAIIIYYFQWIDLKWFVNLFVLSSIIICIWQGIALWQSRRFDFQFWRNISFQKLNLKSIRDYSFTVTTSGLIFQLVMNIDTILLSTMLGLAIVGVYGIYTNIAMLISLPARSITKVTLPLITQAWNNNERDKVAQLYAKSALLQTIGAGWIFLMVLINDDNLFYFLNKPEFKDHFLIYILLGLNYFINAFFGINNTILITSPLYRYDIVFNFIILLLNTTLIYFGIQLFEGEGAAAGACLAVLLSNLMKWYFLKVNFGMDIFTPAFLKVFAIMLLLFGLQEYVPLIVNVYVDIIVRSGILTILFVLAHYFWQVSYDFNDTCRLILVKGFELIGKRRI
jgi:O-antigen/teichoic acid export membrane protein